MLKSRDELNQKITELCKRNIGNVSEIQRIISSLQSDHGIPESISSDILTLRRDADTESEFVLFCILRQLDSIEKNGVVSKFFTKQEIEMLSNEVFIVESVKFPIVFDMVQINDCHWIGKVTVKDVMLLRDASLINYNENAQRTLKRMVSGDMEYYKIALNKSAVNSIIESYKNNSYIPNTITLNLPEQSEYEYKDGKLIIYETPYFDILDGYHRYVAMSNIYNIDRKFNYDMELRIVAFSDTKARHFIWQEDQKTKMAKIDSDYLNKNNYGNQIVQLIIDKEQYFDGIIMRSKGNIDASVLCQLINVLFIKNGVKYSRKQLLEIRDYILNRFNAIRNDVSDFFEQRFSTRYLICLLVSVSLDMCSVEFVNDLYSKSDNSMLNGRTINNMVINRFKKLANGGV